MDHEVRWARQRILACAACLIAVSAGGPIRADWTRWGGPNGDFSVADEGVSEALEETAPALLWKRELGPGESAVHVKGSRLYTVYRDGDREVVVALDPASGETLWRHRYEASLPEKLYVEHGDGPHAPLQIVGDRIFTLGIGGKLHCLALSSGRPFWSRDLVAEFEGKIPACGYGGGVLPYGDLVIVQVGGEGRGVVAFKQSDGEVAWQSQDFGAGYATPILIEVGGEEQAVVFAHGEVAGLDPATGALKWSHAHETEYGVNASTPLWGDDGILVVSSAYDTGTRGLKLASDGEATTVEELWYQRKMQIHFSTMIRVGDRIYGTSGDFGPSIFTAVDATTGELVWQQRSVSEKGSLLRVGEHLLILDEEGLLVLVKPGAEKAETVAEYQILEERVWAPPTLVGSRLYVRTKTGVAAFELAASEEE